MIFSKEEIGKFINEFKIYSEKENWALMETLLNDYNKKVKNHISNQTDSEDTLEDTDKDDEGNYIFTLDCSISPFGNIMVDVRGDSSSYEVIEADNIEEAKDRLESFYYFVLDHFKRSDNKLNFEKWIRNSE